MSTDPIRLNREHKVHLFVTALGTVAKSLEEIGNYFGFIIIIIIIIIYEK